MILKIKLEKPSLDDKISLVPRCHHIRQGYPGYNIVPFPCFKVQCGCTQAGFYENVIPAMKYLINVIVRDPGVTPVGRKKVLLDLKSVVTIESSGSSYP